MKIFGKKKDDKLKNVITDYMSTNTFSDYSKDQELLRTFHHKINQSAKTRDNSIPPICYVCQSPIRGLPIYRRKVFESSDGNTFQLNYHYFPPCAFSSKQPENCFEIGRGLSMPMEWTETNKEKWSDMHKIDKEIMKKLFHYVDEDVMAWTPASTIEFDSAYFNEDENTNNN